MHHYEVFVPDIVCKSCIFLHIAPCFSPGWWSQWFAFSATQLSPTQAPADVTHACHGSSRLSDRLQLCVRNVKGVVGEIGSEAGRPNVWAPLSDKYNLTPLIIHTVVLFIYFNVNIHTMQGEKVSEPLIQQYSHPPSNQIRFAQRWVILDYSSLQMSGLTGSLTFSPCTADFCSVRDMNSTSVCLVFV